MSDYRADSILTGSDYRVGSIIYVAVGVRSVGSVSADIGYPGDLVEISLNGTWDAGGKTATLNGVSLSIYQQSSTYIRFYVPTPYADGSSFSGLNLDTAYTLTVDDSTVNPKSSQFVISSPDAPTYWYISSIAGSPWGESSIFYESTGLSNGDSAFVEVLEGGPMTSMLSDGTFVSANAIRFRAKAYNVDGWGTSWDTWDFRETPALEFVATIPEVIDLPVGVPVTLQYDDEFVGEIQSYSLTGTLPSGLTFDTVLGTISGTPDTVETASGLVITATDGIDTVDSNTFSISVLSYGGPGYSIPLNDYIRYLANNDSSAGGINDSWKAYLTAEGYSTGTINDRQFLWLRALGYTGSLSDMLTAYKADNLIL
jgi:hypothetical protein